MMAPLLDQPLPPLALDGPAWRAHKRAIRRTGKAVCIAAVLPLVRAHVDALAGDVVTNQRERFWSGPRAHSLGTDLLDALDQWCAGDRTPLREAAPRDWMPFRSGRSGRAQWVARTIIALVESALGSVGYDTAFQQALRGLCGLGIPLAEIDGALRTAYASSG